MRIVIFSLLSTLLVQTGIAQKTDAWLRAFPITDYLVDINDSIKLVQVQLPDGTTIKEKTMGVLYGIYFNDKAAAVEKGSGRCNLIKGDYYYFTIGNNKSGYPIEGNELLYVMLPQTTIYYGYIPKLAGHFVSLKDVYDSVLYDRYKVFYNWTEDDEGAAISAMVKDIQFTGNYFKENNASMDVAIKTGEYKGKSTFDMMINCSSQLLCDFFDYIIARPRLYAGREWKVSEVFATWLSEGAPKVKK